jgi:DNA-binding LacI/PurR family transcriptional regulator
MAAVSALSTRRIARLAGVSHVTVARTLRNDPSVAPATARRVRQVLKRHGYRPNPMVSALMAQLRSSRKKAYQPTLAFLNAWWPPTVWWSCPTKTAQFHGAEARAAELGYRLEMFWLAGRGMTSDRMVTILRTRGVQGVLVGPIQHAWKGLSFGWEHFSVATISFSIVEPRVMNAGAAVFQAMARIMAELLARGYRRVGYITSRDFERRVDTLAGGAFRLFQREFPAEDRLEPLIFDYEVEKEAVRSWLDRSRPDVIVTRLPNVYELLGALGHRIPRDLGFAHLDLPPALRAQGVAGIDALHAQVGAAAIELVINQIHLNLRGVPRVPTTTAVYGEFVPGPSLRPRVRGAASRRFRALLASPCAYADGNSFD